MNIDSVQLIAQIGAGADGVVFRARCGNDVVEVRTLSAAWSDPMRRQALVKRLRQARLLEPPGAPLAHPPQPASAPPPAGWARPGLVSGARMRGPHWRSAR